MPFVAYLLKYQKTSTTFFPNFQKAGPYQPVRYNVPKIILLAADGMNNMQISTRVGLGQDSVSKWRGRFLKALPLFAGDC